MVLFTTGKEDAAAATLATDAKNKKDAESLCKTIHCTQCV